MHYNKSVILPLVLYKIHEIVNRIPQNLFKGTLPDKLTLLEKFLPFDPHLMLHHSHLSLSCLQQ